MDALQMAFNVDLCFANVLLGLNHHSSNAIQKTVLFFLQSEVFIILVQAILVEVNRLIDAKIFKSHTWEACIENTNDWNSEYKVSDIEVQHHQERTCWS
jgi:hypothetical protein